MTKTVSAHVSQAIHSELMKDGLAERQVFAVDAAQETGADPEGRIVRDLITSQRRASAAHRLPELSPPEPQGKRQTQAPAQKPLSARREQWQAAILDQPERDHLDRIKPKPAENADTAPAQPQTADPGQASGLVAVCVRTARTPMLLGLLALVVIWQPWVTLALVVFPVSLFGVAYLTLGHDRAAEICADLWRKFEARWPMRAERLRVRLDAVALAWDIVLDRLPENWADRLALPDFSGSGAGVSLDGPDPFDRLSEEARNG
jgi:hypothetical protein